MFLIYVFFHFQSYLLHPRTSKLIRQQASQCSKYGKIVQKNMCTRFMSGCTIRRKKQHCDFAQKFHFLRILELCEHKFSSTQLYLFMQLALMFSVSKKKLFSRIVQDLIDFSAGHSCLIYRPICRNFIFVKKKK